MPEPEPYTPTTDEVRDGYAHFQIPTSADFSAYFALGLEEFDRWLSAYTTRIREEAGAGVVQKFADLIFTAGLRSPESTLAVIALKQVLGLSEIPEGQGS